MTAGWTRAFVGTVVAYALVVAVVAARLPDRVPTHWSGLGAPDAYSGRTGAVLMFVGVGTLMAGLFGAFMYAFSRPGTRLSGLNVPNKEAWLAPEHLAAARVRATEDMARMGTIAMLLILAIPPSILQSAEDPSHALPGWALVVFLLWVAAMLWVTIATITAWGRGPVAGSGQTASS